MKTKVLAGALILGAILCCFYLRTAICSYLAIDCLIKNGTPPGCGDLGSLYTSRANIVSTGIILVANIILVVITRTYVRHTKRMADAIFQSRIDEAKPIFLPKPQGSELLGDGYKIENSSFTFVLVNIGARAVSLECSAKLRIRDREETKTSSSPSVSENAEIALRTGTRDTLIAAATRTKIKFPHSNEEIDEYMVSINLSFYDTLGNKYDQVIPFYINKRRFIFDECAYPRLARRP